MKAYRRLTMYKKKVTDLRELEERSSARLRFLSREHMDNFFVLQHGSDFEKQLAENKRLHLSVEIQKEREKCGLLQIKLAAMNRRRKQLRKVLLRDVDDDNEDQEESDEDVDTVGDDELTTEVETDDEHVANVPAANVPEAGVPAADVPAADIPQGGGQRAVNNEVIVRCVGLQPLHLQFESDLFSESDTNNENDSESDDSGMDEDQLRQNAEDFLVALRNMRENIKDYERNA